MSNQYGYKILLDNTDITDKVKSFSIACSLENYCRELTMDLYDSNFYDSLNFYKIPEFPRIEVLTRITEIDPYDEYEDCWVSQGKFFIERPTYQVEVDQIVTGIWGRQSTAVLGEPFAQKVTKMWDTTTSFYAICKELIESVDLVWDSEKCDIQDFTVYSDTFEADDEYPIETLQKLLNLIVGAEGFITSDRLGNVCIKRLVREPLSSDYDITDLIVQTINEEPIWPEFGNRIKIIPAETVSQNTIETVLSSECIGMSTDISYIDIMAQVKDGNGVPLNNSIVDWSFSPANAEYLGFVYPIVGSGFQKTASQISDKLLISKEVKRADGVRTIQTNFQADFIIGIWAYSDTARAHNFASSGGYIIDGKNVYLTDKQFAFCDQMVSISYCASGMIVNSIKYDSSELDPTKEATYGEVIVIASLGGKEDSKTIYINNFCKCPSSLTVTVDPSSIAVGGVAKITAYVENGGMPVTGMISMVETSGKGTLAWARKQTSVSLVENEVTEVINSIAGVSQCVVSSVIDCIAGTYRIKTVSQATAVMPATQDPGALIWTNKDKAAGVPDADTGTGTGTDTSTTEVPDTSIDYFASFTGKTINLNRILPTGTRLMISYDRAGSVVNYLTGVSAGDAQVVTSMAVNTEEGLSQATNVPITAVATDTGGGGSSDSYYIEGPASCAFNRSATYYDNHQTGGQGNIHNLPVFYQKFVGWTLRKTSDNSVLGSADFAVSGTGYLKAIGQSFEAIPTTPNQTLTITMTYQGASATKTVTYTGGMG